jgi:hypothetical protein
VNPACEKERKNLPKQNETSRRSLIAISALDALQQVSVAMVQPQFQISRNTHRAGELLSVRKVRFLD